MWSNDILTLSHFQITLSIYLESLRKKNKKTTFFQLVELSVLINKSHFLVYKNELQLIKDIFLFRNFSWTKRHHIFNSK